MDKPVDEIERAVGERVRVVRMSGGMTQTKVAEALGVTGQQVQKYERGDNRISAGKLWMLSRILNVEVGRFFEGLDEDAAPSSLESDDVLKAAGALQRISDVRLRERILELVRACSDERSEIDDTL